MNEKLHVEEMGRLDVTQFKAAEKLPLVLVLDHVRSLYNVGSMFRTADAFRLQSLCLCGITATPPHVEIHKTALGAEEAVDWRYYDQTLSAVRALQQEGYVVMAIEQCRDAVMLTDFRIDRSRRYAFVLGNEVKGVDQQVVDACDGVIEIPQFGTKHSMNVSVTAGIVMWEVLRQWREMI
ncbi:MAG: RNA methyltransferase [Bacteroidaceae bacterium]|nr:RNA methyltransferase [Bacteroidaceae bacterium]